MTRKLYYTVFLTAAGWMGASASDRGLRQVTLPQPSEEQARLCLKGSMDGADFAPERFGDLTARLQEYFEGEKVAFPDAVDTTDATPFQQDVWRAARLILYGHTWSYARLAGETGRPAAARATGQALGKNPLPIVVPCHRVLAADGGLGGFSGGIEMKRFLLRLEGVSV
jgi:methylated-DNA-[protein]-cysteine S-methyltransferase